MNLPFRPMAAARELLEAIAEMNRWNVTCTGDDDCKICRETERLFDVFNRARRGLGD